MSSMLKKAASKAFKPKAVRRNAPVSSTQDVEQLPTTEPISKASIPISASPVLPDAPAAIESQTPVLGSLASNQPLAALEDAAAEPLPENPAPGVDNPRSPPDSTATSAASAIIERERARPTTVGDCSQQVPELGGENALEKTGSQPAPILVEVTAGRIEGVANEVSRQEHLVILQSPAHVPGPTAAGPGSESSGPMPGSDAVVAPSTTTAATEPTNTRSNTIVAGDNGASCPAPASETTSNKVASESSAPVPPSGSTRVPISPSPAPAAQRQPSPRATARTALVSQRVQAATPPAEDLSSGQPQPSIEAAGEPVDLRSTTAPKAKRSRKRKAGNAEGEAGEVPVAGGAAGPVKKRTLKKKNTVNSSQGDQGNVGGQATTKPGKRKRTARVRRDGNSEEASAENVQSRSNKRARSHRSVTPEDAENIEVDINRVTMADLTKDMRIGKKFSLHDELVKRQKERRQKYYEKRRLKNNGISGAENSVERQLEALVPTQSGPGNLADGTDASASDKPGGQATMAAPQFQLVDGQIVVDSRSLQIDRHARAAEAAGELEEEEENEFTRHITSATYLRRPLKPEQWTDGETELFYRALSMFGTDFDTISRMFPGKKRGHIKLKFKREDREHPARISAALVGKKTVAMNMDEYKSLTGLEYESAESIYAEQKKAEEEFEARQLQIQEDAAEEARKKREALFGGGDDAENGNAEAGAEGGAGVKKGKRGRRQKKGAASAAVEGV